MIVGFINGLPIYAQRAVQHDPHSGRFIAQAGGSPKLAAWHAKEAAAAASFKANHSKSKNDHKLAAELHSSAANLYKKAKNNKEAVVHKTAAEHHSKLAE